MIEKTLDASVLFSILNLSNQIRLRGDLIYKFADITTQQYIVMLHLASDPNIPFLEGHTKEMLASELADSMKISRPGITNILKTLIQKGFVKQVEDKDDRRQKRLKLTEDGKVLMEEIEPLRMKANKGFLSQFSEEEKEQFFTFITRCSIYAKEQLENPEALEEMHNRIQSRIVQSSSDTNFRKKKISSKPVKHITIP